MRGKTVFISGASRGIGLAIACRLARDGANIVARGEDRRAAPEAARDDLQRRRGGRRGRRRALPVVCDIRDEQQVRAAVEQGVATFGGIDVCINNASAIALTDTLATDMKRYDLMNQVNARGTFLCSKRDAAAPAEGGQPAHPQPRAAARSWTRSGSPTTSPTRWPSSA